MATIREYFSKSFRSQLAVDKQLEISSSRGNLLVDARVLVDVDAHVTFVSVFVPATPLAEKLVEAFTANIGTILALEGVTTVMLPRGGPEWSGTLVHVERPVKEPIRVRVLQGDGMHVEVEKMPFSGRLYVYSEQDFTAEACSRLAESCRSLGLTISFRGPSYALELDKKQRPRAFVCHDSRDKLDLALPIARGLEQLLCPVWYDEFSLHVGQSLREGIERGIQQCTHCILVLSPNFLSNGGWPKREYTMAFTKELVEDRNVVLPVWSDISRDDVFAYSPLLADRLGLAWSLGPDEVCRKLYMAIEKDRDAT